MNFSLRSKPQFHRFAQFLLAYTLFVILWGAWVRISHSGDGCGNTWPLCNGNLVPEDPQRKTLVEFSHRLSSGLFGIFVVFLYWQGRQLFPAYSAIRKALLAVLIFMITEALLGAKLVLLGLVAGNDSWFRVFAMSLHQLNSLMLTGSMALVVLYCSPVLDRIRQQMPVQETPPPMETAPWKIWGLPLVFLLIAVTGAWAALASTLFPSHSVMEGLSQDFAEGSHYLIHLRVFHPIVATVIGGGFALFFWLKSQHDGFSWLRQTEQVLAGLFVFGVVLGYITLFSLAPTPLKVFHLLLAHLLWITLLRWWGLKRFLLNGV